VSPADFTYEPNPTAASVLWRGAFATTSCLLFSTGWALIVPSWSAGRCEKILNKCAKLKGKIILEREEYSDKIIETGVEIVP
jgi:hypothetical protein